MKKNFIFLLTISLTPCWSYGMIGCKPTSNYGKKKRQLLATDLNLTLPQQICFKKNKRKQPIQNKSIKPNQKRSTIQKENPEAKLDQLNKLYKSCECVELTIEHIENQKTTAQKKFTTQYPTTPMPKKHTKISKKITPGTMLYTYITNINEEKYSEALAILPNLHSYNDKTILNELAKSTPAKISLPFMNNETWANYATEPIKKNNFQDFTLYFIDEQIKQAESAQKKQNLNAIKTHLKDELEFDLFS